MRKVLFYINLIGRGGGAAHVLTNIANKCIEQGIKVILATTYDDDGYNLSSEVKWEKFFSGVEKKGNVIYRNLICVKKLNDICRKEKPDLIVAFTTEAGVRAVIAAKINKIPVIVSVRNAPKMVFSGYRGKIAEFLYHYADGIVVQNKYAKEYFGNRKNVMVIPNLIEEKYVSKCYFGNRKKRIVNVGRLVEQKNQKLLINAFSIFHKTYPEWKLCIYGEGELREKLEKQIEEYNLQDYVLLLGVIPNLEDEINQDGMFVLSSDYEGMPNAMMEAMAMGLPTITTDYVGDPSCLIENEVNGIIVASDDACQLADAMSRIAENHLLAEKLSMEASKISKKMNPEKVSEMWISYMMEIGN